MNSQEYQQFVLDAWRGKSAPDSSDPILAKEYADLKDLFIMSTGLAGETGETIELLKKHVRDGQIDLKNLKLELGDILYYLTRVALKYGFTLENIMDANKEKLDKRMVSTRKFVG